MNDRAVRWMPRVLCLIGLYFTIEETFVKWVFGSGPIAVVVRQIPDLFVVGLAVAVMVLRFAEFRVPRFSSYTPILLGLFAVYALAVIVASDGDLVYSLLNLKAFLRYATLFVLLHYFPFDQEGKRFLWRSIAIAVGIQAIVCAWQLAGGESVRNLLVPADIESADPRFAKLFTGARFEGVNDLVGTMGNNIGLSYFLVVVMAVWLAGTRNGLARWSGAFVLLGWNALTGSRAGLLASLVVLLVHESRELTMSARAIIATSFVAILAVALFAMSGDADKGSLLYVFRPEYIEEAINQRLGLVVYLLPELAFSPVVLTGLGPDKYQYPQFFEQIGIQLPWVLMEVLPNVIEDVYWIAIVASYGIFGVVTFAVALLAAWSKLGSGDRCVGAHHDWVPQAGRMLILASLLLAVFSQVYHLRQFSYFFWLVIGIGLQASNEHCQSEGLGQKVSNWKEPHASRAGS